MNLYLYVDESGTFGPGGPPTVPSAVVLGVVTQRSPADFEVALRQASDTFNRNHGTDFRYPRDVHCSPLFKTGLDLPPRYRAIPQETRQEYARALLGSAVACDRKLQLVVCENPRERVDWDIQAAYVANLTPVVWTALKRMAGGALGMDPRGITSLSVVIATRRGFKDLITREFIRRGEGQLRRHLLYACGRAAEVENQQDVIPLLGKLSPDQIEHKAAEGHAGLMVADFCAFFWRFRKAELPPDIVGNAWVTSPEERIPRNVVELVTRLSADDAIGAGDWSALYEFCLRFGGRAGWDSRNAELLRRLVEADEPTLSRQLPGFWHLAERLLERRTENDTFLPAAREIYAAIRVATESCLAGHPSAKTAALYLADSLDGLIRCANHSGDTKSQGEWASSYAQAMDDHAALLGGFSALERRKLELLNRFANVPMNDYRFDEVLSVMTARMEDFRARVPPGQADELLGKLLGTVGQAFAFKARLEPALAEKALDLLTESLGHFALGTRYRSTTLNYLTTLAWQSGDLAAACRWLSQQPNLDSVTNPTDLWPKLRVLCEGNRFFDLANALRILAAAARQESIGPRSAFVRTDVLEPVISNVSSEHPGQQILKWAAVLYLLAGQTARAESLAKAGIENASKKELTIRTIGASLWPVRCAAAGSNDRREEMRDALERDLQSLCVASEGFRLYLDALGGPHGVANRAASLNPDDVWEALLFPPFAYA